MRLLILFGIVYLSGALGIEMVTGAQFVRNGYNFSYSLLISIEESLEILGIIIFVYSLTSYIQDLFKTLTIEIGKPLPPEN